MRVKAKIPFNRLPGQGVAAGEVVEVPDDLGKQLINGNQAELAPDLKPESKPEPKEEEVKVKPKRRGIQHRDPKVKGSR